MGSLIMSARIQSDSIASSCDQDCRGRLRGASPQRRGLAGPRGVGETSRDGSLHEQTAQICRNPSNLSISILPTTPLREFSFVREKRNVCPRAMRRRVDTRSAFRTQMKTRVRKWLAVKRNMSENTVVHGLKSDDFCRTARATSPQQPNKSAPGANRKVRRDSPPTPGAAQLEPTLLSSRCARQSLSTTC